MLLRLGKSVSHDKSHHILKFVVISFTRNDLTALRENAPLRSSFWSVFSHIWTEFEKTRFRKSYLLGHFPHSTD